MDEDGLLIILCAAQAQSPHRSFLIVGQSGEPRMLKHFGLPKSPILRMDEIGPLLDGLEHRGFIDYVGGTQGFWVNEHGTAHCRRLHLGDMA